MRTKKEWRKTAGFGVMILLLVLLCVVWYGYRHYRNTVVRVAERIFTEKVEILPEYHFNDKNNTHLVAAKRNGIRPVGNRNKIPNKLKEVCSCDLYYIDKLTHSAPFLTEGAYGLLTEISTRFQDELRKGGYRPHKIIVTSVLRTKEDVAKLKNVNNNAVSHSAHMYGTTFDITYVRFMRTSFVGKSISNQSLAEFLGRVLCQLRKEGKCHVKYEYRQHCFHITSRM